MKLIYITIVTFCFNLAGFSQEIYTARKGSKFFPEHLDIVIHTDSTGIHYQLFNHWYSLSYAQYRDIKIPMNELEKFGAQNDTLTIILLDNKVKLVDKRHKLNKKIKHQKQCSSTETMRKIAYANELAEKHQGLQHFQLYEQDDLKLPESDFKKLVAKNLEIEIKKQHANND